MGLSDDMCEAEFSFGHKGVKTRVNRQDSLKTRTDNIIYNWFRYQLKLRNSEYALFGYKSEKVHFVSKKENIQILHIHYT